MASKIIFNLQDVKVKNHRVVCFYNTRGVLIEGRSFTDAYSMLEGLLDSIRYYTWELSKDLTEIEDKLKDKKTFSKKDAMNRVYYISRKYKSGIKTDETISEEYGDLVYLEISDEKTNVMLDTSDYMNDFLIGYKSKERSVVVHKAFFLLLLIESVNSDLKGDEDFNDIALAATNRSEYHEFFNLRILHEDEPNGKKDLIDGRISIPFISLIEDYLVIPGDSLGFNIRSNDLFHLMARLMSKFSVPTVVSRHDERNMVSMVLRSRLKSFKESFLSVKV